MRLRIIRLTGPDARSDAGSGNAGAEPDQHERVIGRETLVIGRGAECDWVLPDPDRLLSKRHCELAFQGTVFVLRDTSTNGVFLNRADRPLGFGKTAVLRHGDRFRAAGFEFRVEMVADQDRRPGAAAAPGFDQTPGQDGFGGDGAWGVSRGLASDPFAPAPTAGIDPLDSAGTPAVDWGQDPADAAGAGFEPDGYGGGGAGGFGAFDLPSADPAARGAIPADFDFGGLAAPPHADPWQEPGSAPGGAGQGAATADMAAVMIETLVTLDLHLASIMQRLGLPRAGDGPAARLPASAGPGLVSHLTDLPDEAGDALLRELAADLTQRCEEIQRHLDALPRTSTPDPASGVQDTGASAFGEDPFG